MIDRLNKEADFDGGVVVVQPLAQGLIPMINEQDGLYTLYLRGLQDGQKRWRRQELLTVSQEV